MSQNKSPAQYITFVAVAVAGAGVGAGVVVVVVTVAGVVAGVGAGIFTDLGVFSFVEIRISVLLVYTVVSPHR